MDKLRVIKKLGKGAQGAVFLCENKVSGDKVVLKKVECNDEGEANKAFREAMALEQLSHKYICGYKEFFVNWDKVEETMYVCIVMEFYETGDLEKILKQQRAKEQALPEKVLMKWFGQMVEALAFVHGRKVIHRDLKPSNIFMTKELDICLGDFGVATVMADARTRTRTTVGTMNWMAPEVLERPYDERSDVWSLGCIVLDAATCGFLDHSQSQAALFEIKHSSQRLEEVLKEVEKSYSKDLCHAIRTMLRRKFQQRPSAIELVKLPYVRQSLELSKSELVDGDHRLAAPEDSVKPTTTKRIPDTVEGVLGFLADNEARVGAVVMGIEALTALLGKEGDLGEEGKGLVLKCMATHRQSSFTQAAACQLLQVILPRVDATSIVYQEACVEAVIRAMRSHVASAEVQKEATSLLWAMASHTDCARTIGKLGGIQDVLAALRDSFEDKAIAQACCGALWTLSVAEENAHIVTEEQGIQDIAQAMEEHQGDASVLELACAAIWSLSVEDANVDLIFDLGCIGMMLRALRDHKADAKLAKHAAIALASLVVDENCAFSMINNEDGIEGVGALLDAFRLHERDPEVVENCATCVAELSEHADLREVLLEGGAMELLTKVKAEYAANQEICEMCEVGLEMLEGGGD